MKPFAPWDGKTPTDLPILIKVQGKCSKYPYKSVIIFAVGDAHDFFQQLTTSPLVDLGLSTVDISRIFLVRPIIT